MADSESNTLILDEFLIFLGPDNPNIMSRLILSFIKTTYILLLYPH